MVTTALFSIILAFGLYTYKVGRESGGYVQFWRSILSTGPSRQVTIDLYISIAILCVVMITDAVEVGIPLHWVALYIILALFMGSFGPLFYLIHRLLLVP